jgi:hypothetical protein
VGSAFSRGNMNNSIKNPDTRAVIEEEMEELRQIRIEQVDESSSTAVIVSGAGFHVGNLVTKK